MFKFGNTDPPPVVEGCSFTPGLPTAWRCMNIHSVTGKVIMLQKGHPILYISLMSIKAGTICASLREEKRPIERERVVIASGKKWGQRTHSREGDGRWKTTGRLKKQPRPLMEGIFPPSPKSALCWTITAFLCPLVKVPGYWAWD